jgi:glucose PTS system EIICBA or EIICB component
MKTADYQTILSSTKINMGVFGGIIIGLLAGALYNKYYRIKLPQVLGFFAGKRFVPIITSVAALIFAIIGVNIWGPVQHGIDVFAQWASNSPLGPAFYAAGKRLLIPVGLHHMYYPAFLFQFGQYVSNGVTYFGDSARYFHGDPTAGVFMASEYPILIFGLPGAAVAMILAAKKQNRAKVAGMMISSAFVAFVTGITEPIEFSFIFVAPGLFVFHVLAAFASGIITSLLHIRLGYTFSASVIDYVLGYKFAGKPLMIWPIGIAFFLLYFGVFYFSIKKFDIKTPGREDEGESEAHFINVTGGEKAARVLEAIGGKDNIQVLDPCITRLRLTLNDTAKVDKAVLKVLGAAGILEAGDSVQIIFGTEAERIKDDMKSLISNGSLNANNIIAQKEAVNVSMKNAQTAQIAVPIDGEVVSLDEVPDDVFSGKMLGDGFAVKPVPNEVYAPVSGEVAVLFPTKHAVVIKTDEGLEVLVHIGIDTVKLNGEGFTTHIEQGSVVSKGDLLVTFDKEIIEKRAKSTIIPVIITNMEVLKDINTFTGDKNHGEEAAVINLK